MVRRKAILWLLLLQVSSVGLSSQVTSASRSASRRQNFLEQIRNAARRVSVDPRFVEAIVEAESDFDPSAVSRAGAEGLTQVMPGTAKEYEIHAPLHPLSNLMGACEYLRKLINRYPEDIRLVIAAYNAGPGNVDKYHGIPPFPETQAYVQKVLSIYEGLKKNRR